MTEQQACTLCGAGGHLAANCIWNGSGKGLALAQRIDKNLAERAQFESWVRREWPGAPLHHVRDALPVDDPRHGEYCNENIQRAWVGWQARASLGQPSPSQEGVQDLCRFLAKLYCELDGLRYSTAKLPPEEIVDALICKWPVLQGTRNQLNIKRISEQPYDESNLHAAIAAMLAAAPAQGD